MSRQNDSDPLPYTQVDRAVKSKAAVLSGAIGIPYPFALGALVEFWDGLGDPRFIESLVAAKETRIVLAKGAIQRRLSALVGKPIDQNTIDTMVDLGLLEPLGEDFRVRGMSRYFAPVKKRKTNAINGKKGGEATAAKQASALEQSLGDRCSETAANEQRNVDFEQIRLPVAIDSPSERYSETHPNDQRAAINSKSLRSKIVQKTERSLKIEAKNQELELAEKAGLTLHALTWWSDENIVTLLPRQESWQESAFIGVARAQRTALDAKGMHQTHEIWEPQKINTRLKQCCENIGVEAGAESERAVLGAWQLFEEDPGFALRNWPLALFFTSDVFTKCHQKLCEEPTA